MPDIEVRTNLPAFSAQLKAIGADFEKKAVRSATAAAATVFRKYAQQRAPVLKKFDKRRAIGTLRRAIYVKWSRFQKRGSARYIVSVRSGKKAAEKQRDAFYWRFLEGGWIPRGPGKGLKGGRRYKELQRSRATRGKVSYPFIAPAAAQAQSPALQAFKVRLTKKIAEFSALRTPR